MLNGKHHQPDPVPGPLCSSYAHALPVLDDLTDARLVADTRAHLAECAWCRAQRATYDRFDEALRLHFAPDAMPFLPIDAREFSMPNIHDPVATEIPSDEANRGADDEALHLTITPLPIPSREPHTPRRSWRLATGVASLAAVLVISLLAGLIFVSHGRPQSASNKHLTATPAIVPVSQVSLSAIGMSSETDGWAMGQAMGQNGGSSEDPGYVLHYTDGRWAQVRNTPLKADINAIKMLSPTDGWAIGNHVYHYDGVSWREVSLPVSTQFNAIAAISPTDIWIAGDGTWSGVPDGNATILHYDGKSWMRQATPRLSDYFSITSLSMVSPNDGWAVGSAMVDGSKGYYPPTGAILHYRNGTWRLAKTLPDMEPRTVSMGSATDGWIGGNLVSLSQTGKMGPDQSPIQSDTPKLWRYTDGQWAEVNVPASAVIASEGIVSSIAMSSTTQGWMSVYRENGAQSQDQPASMGPELFHLEQGKWVQANTPAVQHRRAFNIIQTAFLSPDEFWGVGSAIWWTGVPADTSSAYTPTVTPLIVHYKDGVWTVVES
jgi:hypothetical protein